MKSRAASIIDQYEKSVHAFGDNSRTIEIGLSACCRDRPLALLERTDPREANHTVR